MDQSVLRLRGQDYRSTDRYAYRSPRRGTYVHHNDNSRQHPHTAAASVRLASTARSRPSSSQISVVAGNA